LAPFALPGRSPEAALEAALDRALDRALDMPLEPLEPLVDDALPAEVRVGIGLPLMVRLTREELSFVRTIFRMMKS
jgi:hypothetical protein